MKPKKCKVCKVSFVPTKPLQAVCDFGCAIELSLIKREKKEKKEKKEKNAEIRKARAAIKDKDRRAWLKEAQVAVNRYIRARDVNDGCISCDKPSTWGGQWHASHFYATSIRPNLRFNLKNIHRSCSICNKWLSGNLTPYRIKLIHKIGIAEVEKLDMAIESKRWTIEELKEIKAEFKEKLKELTFC